MQMRDDDDVDRFRIDAGRRHVGDELADRRIRRRAEAGVDQHGMRSRVDHLRIERHRHHALRHVGRFGGGERLLLRHVLHEAVRHREAARAVGDRGAFEAADLVAVEARRLGAGYGRGGARASDRGRRSRAGGGAGQHGTASEIDHGVLPGVAFRPARNGAAGFFIRLDARSYPAGARQQTTLPYGQIQAITLDTTSPSVSSTQAHTRAEVKLATWKRQYGIARMPAISGTEARNGPKKRPMKMPGTPHRFMKRSPRGRRSGWRESGQICATGGPSLRPIQYDSQSPKPAPSAAAMHTGQKLMPLGPIR